MTPLPRRTLFAITAVLDVALHARGAPVAAKALAERHGLSPRHLESVLQALVRAGLLKGVRGPRGGYELARERRRVTVGDIVRAVDRMPDDGESGEPGPSGLARDVVGPALAAARELYLGALDAITLADLCQKTPAVEAPDTDFTI